MGYGFSQTPTITVRFANPQFNCTTDEYCVDVQFLSSIQNEQLFGMNVRFFYDDNVLELINFRNFVPGYGPVAPNPPIIATSGPAGPALFNFAGPAEFINGAIQLVNPAATDVLLDPVVWKTIFQICFTIDDLNSNWSSFCPSLVWDLQQNPANGGFLSGDDGVVMTVVDANGQSAPANENVVQFNWQYIGNGSPPYGQPVSNDCISIPCPLPVTLISFSGETTTFGNDLEWKTVDEYNFEGFGIQRSTDLINWSTLDFIESNGNSIGIRSYHYVDNTPNKGKNYYRLELKDLDGQTRFSNIVSLAAKEFNTPGVLFVYPNPVSNGILTVAITDVLFQPGNVAVFNNIGKLILSQPLLNPKQEVEIGDLPAGLYVLMVCLNKNVLVQKIVVE